MAAGSFAAAAALLAVPIRDVVTGGAPPTTGLINRRALVPALVMARNFAGTAGFFAFVPLFAPEIGVPVGTCLAAYSLLILAARLFGAQLPDRL